jgi:threonyl-tRNA synthetase
MVSESSELHALRHSTSHLMASAVLKLFPDVKFGNGPAIENGFYYDFDLEHQLSPEDLPKIEKEMRKIAALNLPYECETLTREQAQERLTAFKQIYKLETLKEIPVGEPITVYHHGRFQDLCEGPHVKNTQELGAFKLTKISGAYWHADEKNKMLQRVYGVAFKTQQDLDEYLNQLEEAKKRDHRKLGQELGLFMITPNVGLGLPVWLPNGTLLRRNLENFLRREQLQRGYQEVITPHIGNLELYKTSGHYPYYKESQFAPIQLDEHEAYLLKPMNCPHHHQIYLHTPKSYRDLPLRLAEFGTVYRFEQSGELNGLSRVRGFTQDDAHIYCTQDQLRAEIKNVIDLTQKVFKTFDMEVSTRLSYRDQNTEKYGGDPALWEQAQQEIKAVADEMQLDYVVAEGEAAFYGPKIDFMVKDAIGRKWQLGTVQVDYVMPERFQLEYIGSDNQKHRPVIIHRAPFGSMERFISILIEHYTGAFPFWLAPTQIRILPISDKVHEQAQAWRNQLLALGYRVEIDASSEKIGYKIRSAQTQKIPYMLVLGQKEVESGGIAVRERKAGDLGVFTQEKLFEHLANEFRP